MESSQPAVRNPVRLTIGLPICNEENTLDQFFAALETAVQDLPPHVSVETIACLNGCTDRSAEIVRRIAEGPIGKKVNLSVIPSRKGKINAQLEIVDKRKHDGPICFMDTDTLPDKNTISALLTKLEDDKGCYVSFAQVEPFYAPETIDKRTYFQEALQTHYASRKLSPPRKYIHGRAFMMRDDKELRGLYDDIEERAARVESREVAERLNLKAGPLVDDIYLTRAIAHKHGLASICEVPGTRVYFHPPEHEEDLFAAIKRTATEIKRLNLLYPEYVYLENKFSRKELGYHQVPAMGSADTDRKVAYINNLEQRFWEKSNHDVDTAASPDGFLQGELWISAPSTKHAFSHAVETQLLPADTEVPPEKVSSVLVVPFTEDRKLVAVRNRRGWDLPGGHVEVTDHNLTTAARREAREEAQITMRHLVRSNVIRFRGANPDDDRYMIVMTGLVDKMGSFVASSEVTNRDVLSSPDFLAKYEAGNASQMEQIIAAALDKIAISPDRRRASR